MERDRSRTEPESDSRNVEAARRAAENRDALAREARRVNETAPAATDHPVDDTGGAGRGGTGAMHASEDVSAAREHVREAAENRAALAEEARRVNATTPPDGDRERR